MPPGGYAAVDMAKVAARKAVVKKATNVPGNSNKPGSKGVVGVVDSAGGRVAPKASKTSAKAAAKAAAKARNNVTGSAPVVPTAPTSVDATPISGNPEDQALASLQNPGYGAVAGGGTNLAGQFDPMNYAKGMAGQQYDPQIVAMATRIKGIIGALPGSLDSLHKAFSNLDLAAAHPAQVNVVGGSTGAQAAYQGTAAALDNVSNASQAASAAAREADWGQRMKLISAANVNDLRGQLGGLNQQKSDATAGYYQQGIKTKSDLVSQAISNINAIRAGNDAEAMVRGNLTAQGLKNDAQSLQNSGTALAQGYYGQQAEQGLVQGNQTIQSNDLAIKAAKNTLTQTLANTPGTQKNLANAVQGGPQAVQALTSLIIPTTGITQNPTTGYSHVMGDPNVWAKNGVSQIMRVLPKSNRANVVKFVNSQISQAVSSAGGWTQNKNGKWIRPK